MSQAIPFSKIHEQLLYQHSEKLDQHSEKLDQHSEKLDRNSKKIDQNTRAIARNTKLLQQHSQEIRRLGVLMEQQESKVDTILEIVTHINKRFLIQDEMSETLENHEHRISAVEVSIKRRHKGASRT